MAIVGSCECMLIALGMMSEILVDETVDENGNECVDFYHEK